MNISCLFEYLREREPEILDKQCLRGGQRQQNSTGVAKSKLEIRDVANQAGLTTGNKKKNHASRARACVCVYKQDSSAPLCP